jgi:hypothetical protein
MVSLNLKAFYVLALPFFPYVIATSTLIMFCLVSAFRAYKSIVHSLHVENMSQAPFSVIPFVAILMPFLHILA